MVYFIQQGDDGPIKIGSTENIAQRIKSLQVAAPVKLRLLAYVYICGEDECGDDGKFTGWVSGEKRMHYQFSAHRLSGEWFKNTPCIIEEIRFRAMAEKFGFKSHGVCYGCDAESFINSRGFLEVEREDGFLGKEVCCRYPNGWEEYRPRY